MRLLAIFGVLALSANLAQAYTLSEQCETEVSHKSKKLLAPELRQMRSQLPANIQLSSKVKNIELKGPLNQNETLIVADYVITENVEGHKASYLYKQIFAVAVVVGSKNGELCGRPLSTSLVCDCVVLRTVDSNEILEKL